MSTILEGLRYAESHEYVKIDGEYGYVGITDYAQHELGNVVYVDMPDVDDETITIIENNIQKFNSVSSLFAEPIGLITNIL